MSEGVRLGIKYAFYTLNLHRVEANIQPENIASIGLVKRMSFAKEGFSRRYLYINGDWRDHERWALTHTSFFWAKPSQRVGRLGRVFIIIFIHPN
jgi:[ribosomal protein S5]-alanine N-acetyltransferase